MAGAQSSGLMEFCPRVAHTLSNHLQHEVEDLLAKGSCVPSSRLVVRALGLFLYASAAAYCRLESGSYL